MLRRYVHGPGVDEPLVQYDGAGTASKSWMHADARGSIIAFSNATGTVTAKNAYDPYGNPDSSANNGAGNQGLFQYTESSWLKEAGLYQYEARAYHPGLGRFMQTDPIGYGDGMNMYAYAGNDPVNGRDPSGLYWSFELGRLLNRYTTGHDGYSRSVRDEGWCNVYDCGVIHHTGSNAAFEFGRSAHAPTINRPEIGGGPGGGRGRNGDKGRDDETDQPKCDPGLVNLGNYAADASNSIAMVSTGIRAVGTVVGVVGMVASSSVLIAAAPSILAVGGVIGIAAGGTQVIAGILQGAGGAGYGNVGRGTIGLAAGAAGAKILSVPAAQGYRTVSQRLSDFTAKFAGAMAGGVYDLVQRIPDMSATHERCATQS